MTNQPEQTWELHQGDCVEWLKTKPDGVADLVSADPPYSSGGAFRSDRNASTADKHVNGNAPARVEFMGDSRDQRAMMLWHYLWMSEALRITKPGGVLQVWTDWRMLAVATDAIQVGGWVFRGIVPWDKTEGSRPVMGRFRSQCEYVVWGSKGPMPTGAEAEEIGVLPGYIRQKVTDKKHIAGKPVEVIKQLLRICPPGGLEVDPFAGASSVGVAAVRTGRRHWGCELSPHWASESRARLRANFRADKERHT
jgi:site-specific DNA-methyltransferase (adenine-specific)